MEGRTRVTKRRNRREPPAVAIAEDHPFYPIIADAYRLFPTGKPASTGVCEHCCMDPAIEADFFNPPIETLPPAYVRDWYSGAYEKWGVPKHTWTYLLPRVLELLALEEVVDNVGLEVALHRFETGNPDHWTAAQWDVLERFRHAYLDRALTDFTQCPYIDDAICMFALSGWNVEDLIEQVAATDDATLAARLFHDWCPFGLHAGSIWLTAFWEGEGRERIYRFYTSDALYERMERLALSDDCDPALADQASSVAAVIEAARG